MIKYTSESLANKSQDFFNNLEKLIKNVKMDVIPPYPHKYS